MFGCKLSNRNRHDFLFSHHMHLINGVKIKARTTKMIMNDQFVWIVVPPTRRSKEMLWKPSFFSRNRKKTMKICSTGKRLQSTFVCYGNEKLENSPRKMPSRLLFRLQTMFGDVQIWLKSESRPINNKCCSETLLEFADRQSVTECYVRDQNFLCIYTHFNTRYDVVHVFQGWMVPSATVRINVSLFFLDLFSKLDNFMCLRPKFVTSTFETASMVTSFRLFLVSFVINSHCLRGRW